MTRRDEVIQAAHRKARELHEQNKAAAAAAEKAEAEKPAESEELPASKP